MPSAQFAHPRARVADGCRRVGAFAPQALAIEPVDLQCLLFVAIADRAQLPVEGVLAGVPALEANAVVASDGSQTERQQRERARNRSIGLDIGRDIDVWAGVYATGSYGRLEAWGGSDIDLFFLYDDADETTRLPWTVFVRLAALMIDETSNMGFPPFSGDGKYLEVQYVRESRPVYREDVYTALLERIIGFYYRDYEDHAEDFLPTFLINDLLRFWRTLTLNYEHHRQRLAALTDAELQRKKAKSALKNYKLKVSRQATCFSMIANLSVEQPPVRPETVIELCRMTPSQRFERLRDHEGAGAIIDELTSEYEQFLEATQHPEDELVTRFMASDERGKALERAKIYGDTIYRLLVRVVPEARMRSLVV